MGHDEHNQTGYLASNQGSEQQPEPPGDEIDWENDGEEDGEQVAAPTPSGKRSRTNEIEGLPDGTDNKRRRT
ncbi:hypothetical protein B0T16DRAFT_458287 [Cercophora newfieldiana]|uniref:Uncharacterized protein n=1 Tax=Cercophora newfieldiana TaxID=92897 RepID=A0AA39Y6N8_9PEZI|nr:hypothetical protein B0T16DRAFT_458287 [Cercophora newfieldiana]